MNDISLFSITVVLFLIMDSIGNISSYLSLTKDLTPQRRRWVLFREMGIALLAMLIFNFIGEYIFRLLGISQTTVRLASGAILFIVAFNVLFPTMISWRNNLMKGEPFIVPLAIPLIAGPGLLATVMLYADMDTTELDMFLAILIATVASFGVLLMAPFLQKHLKNNGLLALEKLMGMILILMGVQRFSEGIKLFLAN